MIVALSAGRDAPGELRERIALDEATSRRLLSAEREGIAELVAVSTCHRTELYAVADDGAVPVHALAALLPRLRPTDQTHMRLLRGREAIEHLFRVAGGLDSLVVGEPQILGQVRRAYTTARELQTAGPMLSTVFSHALRAGRRVRSAALLGAQVESLGTLAARHLERTLGGLTGRQGAIVGAGKAATDSATAVAASGAKLTVVGRSPGSTSRLAGAVGARMETLEKIGDVLRNVDFAIVAVSGGRLVGQEHVPPRNNGRSPLNVVDLSVPRSVHLDGRSDVTVISIDALEAPKGPGAQTLATVEAMLSAAVDDLMRRIGSSSAGRAAGELRAHASRVVEAELNRSITGLGLSDDQRERVEVMAMRIANKLVHGPAVACRGGDETTVATIRSLFGLTS